MQVHFQLFVYNSVDCVFVWGNKSTGKTLTVKKLLSFLKARYSYINCVEFSNQENLMFESILNQLVEWTPSPKNDYKYQLLNVPNQQKLSQSG